jgi:pseudouridine synthase
MSERVQKILREWGIASRREAETMILAGKVKVNGIQVQLGDKANAQFDKIEVDGKVITDKQKPNLVYILLNKPKDVICTCEDPRNRKTVLDFLSPELRLGKGIHPIGRLDRNSTGALLLTNDGGLTLSLSHPRYHLPKTYLVSLAGNIPNNILKSWAEGFIWEGKLTLPADIEVIKRQKGKTQIKIILKEGRNRQIRRIAESFGYPVIQLHRTAISFLTLTKLAVGKYRFLNSSEVKQLYFDSQNFSQL